MEQECNQLNQATWDCKDHVVLTPWYRKKVLFGKIKHQLGQVFHDLARRALGLTITRADHTTLVVRLSVSTANREVRDSRQ